MKTENLKVGDRVKIMPDHTSHYTNKEGEIVREMPDGKTYEIKIKHKAGNEFIKFNNSELVPDYKYAKGGTIGDKTFEYSIGGL